MSGLLQQLFRLDGHLTGWGDGYGSGVIMSGSLTSPGVRYPIIMEGGHLCHLLDGAGFLLQEELSTGGLDS